MREPQFRAQLLRDGPAYLERASRAPALACALRVLPDGRVAFDGATNYPLPESCMTWKWFGMRCPGCGLTRSFIYLAHGDWRASLAVHRVGWVLALAVLAQLPYRAASLAWPQREFFSRRSRDLFGTALIVVLLVNWVWNIAEPWWR